MDEKDNINIFLSEGAGQDAIVREMEERGKKFLEMLLGMFA